MRRNASKIILVSTLMFCGIFSLLFAGVLSHELSANEQHAHGYQYSHSLLDLHNMEGGAHQHDTGENGSTIFEPSIVLASTSISFLALLGLIAFSFFFVYREKIPEQEYRQQYRNHRIRLQLSSIISYFTRIFARGILHPKTF